MKTYIEVFTGDSPELVALKANSHAEETGAEIVSMSMTRDDSYPYRTHLAVVYKKARKANGT